MIPQIGAGNSYAASSTEPNDSLGKDVFLNLLITQLKHQDPLEPMEGTEFVTQLAQFSELDELRELTGTQENLQNYMASLNNFAAVSLLGEEVAFSGDQVTHQEGTSSEIRFNLPLDAVQVTIYLYDARGNLVHTLNQGPMEAGNQTALWNGADDTGQPLPSGTYRCEVVAKDSAQGLIDVQQLERGLVQEVAFEDGVPQVRVGGRWISLSDIQGIRTPSAS
jgi:flagellar basal-body rod modification protein FlgD